MFVTLGVTFVDDVGEGRDLAAQDGKGLLARGHPSILVAW